MRVPRPLLRGRYGLSWEMLLTVLLFASLITTVVYLGTNRQRETPYDLNSGSEQGLLALRLWLDDLGYKVTMTGQERFILVDERAQTINGLQLLFVFPGRQQFTEGEVEHLYRWLDRGNTLVIAGDQRDPQLVRRFGVGSRPAPIAPQAGLRVLAPIVSTRSVVLGQLGSAPVLELSRVPEAVPVIGASGQAPLPAGQGQLQLTGLGRDDLAVTAAVQKVGNGRIWHLSRHHDLTNATLNEGQGVLVPALLRYLPPRATIIFDTYHLYGPEGPDQTGPPTIQTWLATTPPGWAIILSSASLGLYLLLAGRRLGPALPALTDLRRREAAEYVTAMAGLFRRVRARPMVVAYHRRRLVRRLARAFQLAPDRPTDEFLFNLQRQHNGRLTELQLTAIRGLLTELDGQPDEAALVRLVTGVDEVLTHL